MKPPLPGSKWKIKGHIKQSIYKDIVIESATNDYVYFADSVNKYSYNMAVPYFYKLFEPIKGPNEIWRDLNLT
jgi:hypothetical protein